MSHRRAAESQGEVSRGGFCGGVMVLDQIVTTPYAQAYGAVAANRVGRIAFFRELRVHARGERWRALDSRGQATKGAWGMSWRQETLKGVEDCEKLGEAVKQALIPRYPNCRPLNP